MIYSTSEILYIYIIFEYSFLFQVRFFNDFEQNIKVSVTPYHFGYTAYEYIENEG